MKKMVWIRYFTTIIIVFVMGKWTSAQEIEERELLPTSEQKAEELPHFPTRTAAFVWRNWNLAPIEALARTLKVEELTLMDYAQRLGLPEYRAPTWDSERAYITLLRRNWSLLPYEQLLLLLDLSPAQLAKKLREDDFLAVKLGGKPYCEPLIFEPPTPESDEDLARIAEIARPLFESRAYRERENLFGFLEQFDDKTTSDAKQKEQRTERTPLQICYLHSYFAVFGDPLLQDSRLLYPDKLLERLAERGVNGVWLHVVLRDVAPSSELFPEFGENSATRRATLRDLVVRTEKYGISVYLYMNEPRALPASFYDNHPNERGVVEGAYCAMCASAPKTRQWLVDSLSGLFEDVPGLGGIFTITGSENLTSCVSHGKFADCPRCSRFSDADLIVDLNAAMEEGVHRAAPDAKVIVWDWGWRGHGLATDIIARLPKGVWLQSVSEWGLPLKRGGVEVSVGEYSISVVGPGVRAKTHWRAAHEAGLKTVAKCQFNTTWEIGSTPSIPAFDLIALHVDNLRREGVDGVMASWSLGGYPSANLELVQMLFERPTVSADAILDELASRYYEEGALKAREGWRLVSEGFQEFPYAVGVVYNAPVQIGAANLLRLKPSGWKATMVGVPYDDLERWCGPYPPDVFESQLCKCSDRILQGAVALELAAKSAPEEFRAQVAEQVNQAHYMGNAYQSVANQVEFLRLRDRRIELMERGNLDSKGAEQIKGIEGGMKELARLEIGTAETMFKLCLKDSRFGFESTNQYWVVPNDLVEKILSCRQILQSLGEDE